jgi:photosystem II stability/assembly factor-like uncharacterized protein
MGVPRLAVVRQEIEVGARRVVLIAGAVVALVGLVLLTMRVAPAKESFYRAEAGLAHQGLGEGYDLALPVQASIPGVEVSLDESPRHVPLPTPLPGYLPAPITLAQAWEALDAHAQAWQSGAEIGFLCSVDDAEDSASSGVDGRRRAWHAVILDTSPSGASLSVLLLDGSISEETTLPPDAYQPTLIGELEVDSPEALSIALAARPDFVPALPGAKGVHFCLEVSDTGAPVITVRGGRGRQPAIVSLDATTGTVLAARHQTLGLGGILYSSDGGQTWSGREFPGVPAVTADPSVEDNAYAATTEDSRIAVYHTQDSGETWAPVGTLPAAAGDWPFAIEAVATTSRETQLIVGTWSGLWSRTDGGQWSLVPGLPEGPKQWLAAVRAETGYRLFVSVTAGEHRGTYATVDLVSWEKVADLAYRLSESFDHSTVLASNEQQADQALVLSIDSQTSVKVTVPVVWAAGDFACSAPALVYSPALGVGRGLSEVGGWTLFAAIGSLAAAPDFPASQVVVAGGFRSGIYRTTDAGRTWEQVVADPSAIVPGNGEMTGLEFLSPTTVIAVNGGGSTWKDF